MNTRPIVLASLVVAFAAGCAAEPASDASSDVGDEALTAAPMPVLTASGDVDVVKASGLPVLFGLPAAADGTKVRELVFVETTVPDGPDADGRPRFKEIRYEKRQIAFDPGFTAALATPTGGVANGAMLVSSADGKVRDAVLATANNEIKKLWDTHPDGRFSIKMFPGNAQNMAHTGNGFTVSMTTTGTIVARNGVNVEYVAEAGLATEERLTVTTDGLPTVSKCNYHVAMKEAAVLSAIAGIAIFHVERTLVSKVGAIQCTKSEDKYVIGL